MSVILLHKFNYIKLSYYDFLINYYCLLISEKIDLKKKLFRQICFKYILNVFFPFLSLQINYSKFFNISYNVIKSFIQTKFNFYFNIQSYL